MPHAEAEYTGVTYTASEAFAKEGVWFEFETATTVATDSAVNSVLVFDGEGNVTEYNFGNSEVLFGEFDGLTEDEIVTLAAEMAEEAFAAYTEEMAETANEWQEWKEMGFDDAYLSEMLDYIDSLEYTAPSAVAYTLYTEGNKEYLEFESDTDFFNTEDYLQEGLVQFDCSNYSVEELIEAGKEYCIENYSYEDDGGVKTLRLNVSNTASYTVGSMTVCGYKYLVTLGVDEYTLDE